MRDINYLRNNGVDVDHGVELLGDMETYDSIMQDYLNAYNDRMNKINTYKINSDMESYAIEVHSLKSDSKYLGLNTLADIAYKHEMASKSGDVETVNSNYQELIGEATKAITIVKNYLNSNVGNTTNVIPVVTPDPVEVVMPKVDMVNSNTEQVQVITPDQINKATKAILVADDSNITRNFVSEIFSNEYEVLMASNGNEVINIVNSRDNIAALLLDLNMPVVDGYQVLEYFKQNNLFAKIPVSIISGSSDKETIDKAFSYPIVDMLNKPFGRENVKSVVEKTIDYKNIM